MLRNQIQGIPFFHVANSEATLSIPDSHFDAVRPGLALYGIYPSNSYFVDLQPALPLENTCELG